MNSRNLINSHLRRIISKLQNRINYFEKKSNKFSLYRVAVFLTGTVLTILAFFVNSIFGWAALIFSLAGFSILVHFHNRLLFGMKRTDEFLKIKIQHIARMEIDWGNINLPLVNEPAADQTMEKDLDLTGERSLHHLIDFSVSYEGSSLLKKWFTCTYPDLKIIPERQKIIEELSKIERFRDKFLLKSHMISKKPLHGKKIINWLSKTEDEKIPPWLLPVSSVLIITYLTLFVLFAIGFVTSIWLIFFLIYFFIYSYGQRFIGKIIASSTELDSQFKKFSLLILLIDKLPLTNQLYLKKFLAPLKDGNASSELKSLHRIVLALLLRANPILRLIVNAIFPYDVFFARKLVTLKIDIKNNIPVWLEKFNELECLISLSNFYYLNPDYTFSQISANEKNVFSVKSIGHPLIRQDKKVKNDISLHKEREILIITGSNMSGKSTFLKTIGINFALTNAGAPVDAVSFKTSLFDVFTCIKVNDSVTEGISYFYAEVKRLKELLDEVKTAGNIPVFFLIDEIFKGTNNKERLIGSRAFIKELSGLNCAGAVSTHDLELVSIAEEINSISNYHFREEILNGKMHFDYKIHSGPCPTTNALKIMEISGLPIE